MGEIVQASHVFLGSTSTTVDEVLAFLAAKAVDLGVATDQQAVYESFKAREDQGTTGLSDGFAIPHAKSAAITEPAVLVVKFAGDVEWESMDHSPIKVAIALLVPESSSSDEHLKLLAKIAVLLMDGAFRSGILDAEDEATIAERVNAGLNK